MLLHHVNAEKEQRKEQERIDKERMRRLMAEDEEGYRKLIDQKKDKRLAFLLQQTDEYIANLTEMVKQHKVEQRRKMREQRRRKVHQNDDGTVVEDFRVTVVETATGTTLSGEEAPLASQLQQWLEAHPGWEEVVEEVVASDEERQEEESKKAMTNESKLNDKVTAEVINKAKAEDDEYKTDDGEKNYYSIAHTIHESIHGQASIMVSGKLKGNSDIIISQNRL